VLHKLPEPCRAKRTWKRRVLLHFHRRFQISAKTRRSNFSKNRKRLARRKQKCKHKKGNFQRVRKQGLGDLQGDFGSGNKNTPDKSGHLKIRCPDKHTDYLHQRRSRQVSLRLIFRFEVHLVFSRFSCVLSFATSILVIETLTTVSFTF